MGTVQIRNQMFDCKRRVTIVDQSLAAQAHESHPQTRERKQHEHSMRSGRRMCAQSLVLPCSSSCNMSEVHVNANRTQHAHQHSCGRARQRAQPDASSAQAEHEAALMLGAFFRVVEARRGFSGGYRPPEKNTSAVLRL